MSRVALFACAIILLCGWQPQPASANPILVAKQAIQFGFQIYKGYNKIKDYFAPEKTMEQNMTAIDRKMFDMLDSVSEDIERMKKDITDQFSKLDNKLTTSTNKLFDYFAFIQAKYDKFLGLTKDTEGWHNSTLKNFVDVATSERESDLPHQLKMMHERLTQKDMYYESIISMLVKKENTDLICVKNRSPQQLIHDLYKTVVEMHVKGLMMQMFAYDIKESWGEGSFEKERENVYQIFDSKINQTFIEVKRLMGSASRKIWKCDPIEHTNDTFSKIKTFQAFINFEADIKGTQSCSYTCEDYREATPLCNKPFCQRQPAEKRCHGKLRYCKRLGYYNRFCASDRSSDRRYEFIETTDTNDHSTYKLQYGQKKSCANELMYQSWEKGSDVGAHCDVCLCTCEDTQLQTDRYFSLNDAISDTYENLVVTGVRFVKKNHVFYIQIQQGRLGASGTIDPDTVDWKAVENQETFENLTVVQMNNYEVTWDQKTIYLDDVEPPTRSPEVHEVITGLRFKKVGTDLKLEIERTAFDYATGLLKGRPKWYSNEIEKVFRSAVELKEPEVPTNTNTHVLSSKSSQYVQFTTTDFKKDVAQSTIPYIDLQELVTSPSLPLSGVGIFLKGAHHSGGFLALKLIHYDFTKHLEEK